MKTILIIALSILVFLLIILFPFKSRLQGHINLNDFLGVYSIKVLVFPILVGRCKLTLNKGLVIENAVNHLYIDKDDPKVSTKYSINLIESAKVSKLDLIFGVGLSDAFLSAITAGSIAVVSNTLSAMVLTNNPNASVLSSIEPKFNENCFELTMQLSIEISLFKIFMAFVKAKKEYKAKCV